MSRAPRNSHAGFASLPGAPCVSKTRPCPFPRFGDPLCSSHAGGADVHFAWILIVTSQHRDPCSFVYDSPQTEGGKEGPKRVAQLRPLWGDQPIVLSADVILHQGEPPAPKRGRATQGTCK